MTSFYFAMFLPPLFLSNARSSLFYCSKLSLQRRHGERPSLYLAVFLPLPLFLLMLEALSSIAQSFLFNEEMGRGLASTLQCSFPSPTLSSNARSSLFYYSKLSLQRREGGGGEKGLASTLQCSFPIHLFLLMLEALSSITQSFLFKEERGRGLASPLQCSFPLFLLMLEALSSITQSFLFKEEKGRGIASTL